MAIARPTGPEEKAFDSLSFSGMHRIEGRDGLLAESNSVPLTFMPCRSAEREHAMKQMAFSFPIPEDYEVIFRASITLKSGKVLFAKFFGIRGFPILVKKTKIGPNPLHGDPDHVVI